MVIFLYDNEDMAGEIFRIVKYYISGPTLSDWPGQTADARPSTAQYRMG